MVHGQGLPHGWPRARMWGGKGGGGAPVHRHEFHAPAAVSPVPGAPLPVHAPQSLHTCRSDQDRLSWADFSWHTKPRLPFETTITYTLPKSVFCAHPRLYGLSNNRCSLILTLLSKVAVTCKADIPWCRHFSGTKTVNITTTAPRLVKPASLDDHRGWWTYSLYRAHITLFLKYRPCTQMINRCGYRHNSGRWLAGGTAARGKRGGGHLTAGPAFLSFFRSAACSWSSGRGPAAEILAHAQSTSTWPPPRSLCQTLSHWRSHY